jgi:lipopolysaccharide/colanic/teichoic acid biosynthesis glycosyltransferase
MCSAWPRRCAPRWAWREDQPQQRPCRPSAVSKRLFDVVVALLGLLLLAPLCVALALLIKLDSPGPVFFRQERVGQHGRLFRIHKFRSMRADATGLPLTVGADARITRAGAWLRRTRLDELPQLIDVLQGRMSLVGPRPEVPRYVAFYPAHLRERALAVRPGITDPASLEFLDEATLLARAADPEREYIEHILPIKLQRAADYAQQASVRTDLAVLWRTLRVLWRAA